HYCLSYFTTRLPPISTLFPYTTLFRSGSQTADASVDPSIRFESSYTSNSYCEAFGIVNYSMQPVSITGNVLGGLNIQPGGSNSRSEEHTSELQSRENLVCRLLLEKKKQ